MGEAEDAGATVGDGASVPGCSRDRVERDPLTEAPGSRIGPYELLQCIGEGGFGRVFLAEQHHPIRRRVALKIIKLGMDTRQVIARFEAERQALVMMDHPCIAKVLDAGATDAGRPYFVMELVKGVPITEYCDEQKLSTPQRLGLFIRLCEAVQHAHQKGIIHRDLKPGNVLVALADDGPAPKIIDFGIAKATNAALTEHTYYTESRQLIGTPEYMSPEQAGMTGIDIDTRSDIYSLGVLLYELLTGTTPFDARKLRSMSLDEIQRMIREVDPPRPSTRLSGLGDALAAVAAHRRAEPGRLAHCLRGELDWIVMKCLEKDRTRRYDSATALAMDVRRYMRNETVLARPGGSAYRLRKFVARHARGVTAAAFAGVAFLALLAWLALATRSERQSRLVSQQAAADAVAAEKKANDAAAESQRIAGNLRTALREAQRLRAEQTLHEGDRLVEAGRLADARQSYFEAWSILLNEGLPLTPAVAAMLDNLDNPPPLMGFADEREGVGGFTGDTGHARNITCIVATRDGTKVFSAAEDGAIKLWDLKTGREMAPPTPLPRHGKGVTLIALSPDGRTLLSASHNGEVWLSDAVNGGLIRELSTGGIDVWAAAFSPDGNLALAGNVRGEVAAWDLRSVEEMAPATQPGDGPPAWSFRTKPCLGPVKVHAGSVAYIAVAPDGRHALSGSRGDADNLLMWRIADGRVVRSFPGQARQVNCVQYLPGGRRAISAGFDGAVALWDLEAAEGAPRLLAGHGNGVWRVASDGRIAVSGSMDESVRLWDVENAAPLMQMSGQKGQSMGVALAGDGRTIIASGTCAEGDTLRVWQYRPDCGAAPFDAGAKVTGVALWSAPGDGKALADSASPQRGQMVLYGTAKGGLVLWDAGARRPLALLEGHRGEVRSVALSGDASRAISGSADGAWRAWDLQNRRARPFPPEAGAVQCAALVPGGDRIALASEDGSVLCWEAGDGQRTEKLLTHGGGIVALGASEDGRTLMSASRDGVVRLYDLARRAPAGSLEVKKPLARAVLCGAGDIVVAAAEDGTFTVWRPREAHTHAFAGEGRPVVSLALSRDGQVAWVAGGDGRITLWNTDSGASIRSIEAHAAPITSLALSGDDACAVSAAADGTIRVWDFLRPAVERDLEARTRKARPQVPGAAALAVFGQWHAFHGKDDWARDCLREARARGADVPSLALARCCWRLSDGDPALREMAAREFARAIERKEAPEAYLRLCLRAVSPAGGAVR